jgi:hypothetical protein
MTPTLAGRWQTRLLLLGTAGVAVTLLFGWIFSDFRTPLALLFYVLVLGFAWDALYHLLQGFRWDGDWPPLFQLIACIVEGLFLWILATDGFLRDGLPGVSPNLSLARFAVHYGLVWLVIFALLQGTLKVIFPRWRFRGGQWL